jgi:hypothetical protein
MDPNTCLAEIRKLSARLIAGDISIYDDAHIYEEVATELADKFTALDLWLSGGGFIPKDWE